MSTINNITATQSSILAATGKSTTQQAALAASLLAGTAKNADQVTLSGAGKALAADESHMTQTRTPAQERLIRSASSDSASAEKIAYGMASVPSTIFFDISGQPGVPGGNGDVAMGVRKLSSTGQIVGDDYVNNFDKVASVIDAQRLAIYESEKANGTDPLLILVKMIDFTNSQSQDYLDATGWGWRGS
ncbi:hypothetical protein [Devosia sp.]|uniref:hypothetical protein n=1 Tax=Devosia sp. TaxID=1871048 RepID=UPI0027357DD9|nr:hypothetical protein [Devosia sp.]MDP2779958.1 hypothetical protein [Devosia sp.]